MANWKRSRTRDSKQVRNKNKKGDADRISFFYFKISFSTG